MLFRSGHASLATGTVPAIHGVIGNDWQDQESGLPVYCTRDTSVHTLGSLSGCGQESALRLLSPTIGEELRLANNFRSKVFSVSIKDRGAILTCGSGCNAAFWYDDSTGRWISGSSYLDRLPDWAERYNSGRKADSLLSIPWNLLYPSKTYHNSTEDSVVWERSLPGEEKPIFPHHFKRPGKDDYSLLPYSPNGIYYTFDFCSALIENENLGQADHTDMLNISISPTDVAGQIGRAHV